MNKELINKKVLVIWVNTNTRFYTFDIWGDKYEFGNIFDSEVTTVSKPQTSTSCLEKMDNNKAPNIPSVYSVGTTNTSRFNKISGIISLNGI